MPHASLQTTSSPASFVIEPGGLFSLREAAEFGFGQRRDSRFDGVMRLAFCLDGFRGQAGVSLRQCDDGRIVGEIQGRTGRAEHAAIAKQVARVLSLDKDARDFVELVRRDPVLLPLLAAAPGMRPPLFYSPYEAALWAVLSARRSYPTGQRFRQRLSEAAGARFEVADQTIWSVPLPESILELGAKRVQAATGIETLRAERVVAIARAAESGIYDADALVNMQPDAARARLQTLPGIGPFYADLILVRASGATDVLPLREPRLLRLIAELYGLDEPADAAALERISRAWSPWRTWVAVLIRLAGPRVLAR